MTPFAVLFGAMVVRTIAPTSFGVGRPELSPVTGVICSSGRP